MARKVMRRSPNYGWPDKRCRAKLCLRGDKYILQTTMGPRIECPQYFNRTTDQNSIPLKMCGRSLFVRSGLCAFNTAAAARCVEVPRYQILSSDEVVA